MAILVTGGCGYIGSVAVQSLLRAGHEVVVIDNLSSAPAATSLSSDVVVYEGDLTDSSFVDSVFSQYSFFCVLHFAGYKSVSESMDDAVLYSDNITGSIVLLNAMVAHHVPRIIFSSSAAVYGDVEGVCGEESATHPLSLYGETKLIVEQLLAWYYRVHGISYVAFRYFNVAGNPLGIDISHGIDVCSILHGVTLGRREFFTVFGDNYDSRDGSAVRDFIDVRDLVDAHVLAVSSDYSGVLNLGSGSGYTILELCDMFKDVSGNDFEVRFAERRESDIGVSLADISRVREVLGWEPKRSLREMVGSVMGKEL